MNLKLQLAVLFICGGLLSGTDNLFASQTVVPYFPAGPEQAGFSFADLDARDADNRPVSAPQAQEELQTLFRSGLYDLLVRTETHTIALAMGVIRTALDLDAQSLARDLPRALGSMVCALFAPQKRTGQVVLAMLSLLLAGAAAIQSLEFFRSLSHSAFTRTPLLFARC